MLINIDSNNLYFENQKTEKDKKEEKEKKEEKRRKKYRNVVKKSDILCNNEIRISEMITQLPFFFIYFQPIINYSDFKLAEIDNEQFEKCRVLQNSSEYYLLQYNNRENSRTFLDFFNRKNGGIKSQINKMINTFKSLLKITDLLCNNNIVNLNLVPQNILFCEDGTPFIVNFDQCFQNGEQEIERNPLIKTLFSHYDPRKIHLPPEVHLLCYMNANNYISLSMANIETVINDWYSAISLSPIGKYIFKGLKADYILFLRNLINKPKNVIEIELYSLIETWNYYSLSIIGLYILSLLSLSLSLNVSNSKHIFIEKYVGLLKQNIAGGLIRRDVVCSGHIGSLFDKLLYSVSEKEWNQLFI
jgi:hypothetical protein